MNKSTLAGVILCLAFPLCAQEAGVPDSVSARPDSALQELPETTVNGRKRDGPGRLPYRPVIVDREAIEKAGVNNILDLLDRKHGALKKIDCSVCNTAQLRLLGLNGAYTQILVDGIPSYSGLGQIYGVEQISLANVERVEIIQGVGSVKHGNSAVAGIVNVITAKPKIHPEAQVSVRYGEHNEQDYEGAYSGRHGPLGVQFSFGKNSSPALNPDGDRTHDVAEYDRATFAGKADVPLGETASLYYAFQSGYEDRFGGTTASSRRWIGEFQAESTFTGSFGQTVRRPLIYQEYVQSKRVSYEGGLKTYPTRLLSHELRVNFTEHYQNGYYGYMNLEGKQRILFAENDVTLNLGQHEILAGGSYQFDSFNDNRSLGSHEYHVPALYFQETWKPGEDWRVLAGMRGDWHSLHGLLLSPRAGLTYSGLPGLSLRLHGGSGFRTFNLFSEDHAAVTTDVYYVETDPDLRAEKSHSVLGGAEWIAAATQRWEAVFDLSAHQTWIEDFIQSYYLPAVTVDGRQKVIYLNLPGTTVARGAQATWRCRAPSGLGSDGGISVFDNYSEDGDQQGRLYNTPEYVASLSLLWEWRRAGLGLALDASRIGPQRLREIRFGNDVMKPERESLPYDLFDASVEQRLGPCTFSLAVKNIGDFYQAQREPILYVKGSSVITNSVFAPLKGRTFYLGLRGRFGGPG